MVMQKLKQYFNMFKRIKIKIGTFREKKQHKPKLRPVPKRDFANLQYYFKVKMRTT